MFWDMFIIDAYIGNFDRHGSNWGFIKNLSSDTYCLAPVFDNGSCLFPRVTNNDEMLNIMNNESEISERVYKFPTSQGKLNGKKSSYFEITNSLNFPECNKALSRFCEKLDSGKIDSIINETPFISDINKDFYKLMLTCLYQLPLIVCRLKVCVLV